MKRPDLEDLDHHQQKFDYFRKLLIEDMAWKLDRERDVLALDTLDELARLLRTGAPSQATLDMLADFLEDVTAGASQQADEKGTDSANAWKEAKTLAYHLLKLKPNGRHSKGLWHQRMLAAFETHKGLGASDEDAKRAAYDAYFQGEGRTYEKDNSEINTFEGDVFSKAELTMRREIIPKLADAGLIHRKPRGRPKR